MRPIWKLLPALGLCAGFGMSSVHAQPPMGRPGGAPGAPPTVDRGGPMGERRADPKPDAQVDAWVKTLTDKMCDPHDSIRDSSRAGIISVGRAALPSLKKLADGDDGAKATAARRLIDAIEHRPMPGMGGGMPGMPPGGMPPFGGRGGFGGSDGGSSDGPRGVGRRPDAAPAGGGSPRGEGRRPNAAPDRPAPAATPAPERRPDAPAAAAGRVSPIAESLKDLKLNDKQQKQVTELRENFEKTMQETMAQVREGKIEQADVREKMQKMRGTMLKEMKDVLTAEQFEKFEEALKKNRPTGGPGGAPGERPRPE